MNRSNITKRIGHPIGQQSGTHRRNGSVENPQQRALAASITDRAANFQTAATRLIDFQRASDAVGRQPVDVFQGTLLSFREVVDHGPGRADGLHVGCVVSKTKPFEIHRAEVLGQRLARGLLRKRPRRTPCGHHPFVQVRRQRRGIVAQQTLGRRNAGQLIEQLSGGKPRGREPAGRKFNPRQSHRIARRYGRQKVALARIEQGVVRHRAGRYDARYLATDQALCQLRVFHLLAHRGTHARCNQLGQIAFQLMMRKACHGDGIFVFRAACERQVEHASGRLGVVVEHLVEVTHAKQQKRIGTCPFRFLILFHHGGDSHPAMLTTESLAWKGEPTKSNA